jgi:hypothetical protein
MDFRNSIAALFAIVALACLGGATRPTEDRVQPDTRQGVSENHTRNAAFISTRCLRRRDDGTMVRVLYRFGTKSLSIHCSSAECFVVISKTKEA